MKENIWLLVASSLLAACSFDASAPSEDAVGSLTQAVASPSPSFTVVGQTDTGFIPPDTDGAVSSSFIVSTTNDAINIKNRTGAVLFSQGLDVF